MNNVAFNHNYWIEYNRKFSECQHLFSKSAYFTAKSTVTLYENSIHTKSSIKNISGNPIPGRKTDDIKFFSKNSRTRLFKLFSCISFNKFCKIYFCSLSFHYDFPVTGKDLKVFLDKFKKRIKRIDENLSFVWRFEFQKRDAPHFHFIFFIHKNNKTFRPIIFERNLRKAWFELKGCNCKDCLQYSFDLNELECYRKAIAYVSKYVAKENQTNKPEFSGRRWGHSNNIPLVPLEVFTIPCYRFLYLKKLLYNYYKNDKSKSEYLLDNLFDVTSFFLFADNFSLSHIFNRVLYDKREFIFNFLRKDKIIPSCLVFDEINLLIRDSIYPDQIN